MQTRPPFTSNRLQGMRQGMRQALRQALRQARRQARRGAALVVAVLLTAATSTAPARELRGTPGEGRANVQVRAGAGPSTQRS